MAWIVLSGTPSRYRFVASPRRKCVPTVPRQSRLPLCGPNNKPRQLRQIQWRSGLRLKDQSSLWIPRCRPVASEVLRQGRYDGTGALLLFICDVPPRNKSSVKEALSGQTGSWAWWASSPASAPLRRDSAGARRRMASAQRRSRWGKRFRRYEKPMLCKHMKLQHRWRLHLIVLPFGTAIAVC